MTAWACAGVCIQPRILMQRIRRSNIIIVKIKVLLRDLIRLPVFKIHYTMFESS